MFCIAAFVVLSIMGIFSATNRALAREALDCVLRRVTFRPCTTGFDEKMKAKILGSLINRSEVATRIVSKNFEVFAWVFLALFLLSGGFAVRGLYLYYTTGSCNGLNSTGFCVFDPTGKNNQVSAGAAGCKVPAATGGGLSLQGVDLTGLPVLNQNSADKIVMIGCYHCSYTRETYPIIRDLALRFNANLTYFNAPVKEPDDSYTKLGYCVYQTAPDKYWQLNDLLFSSNLTSESSPVAPTTALPGPQPAAAVSDPLVQQILGQLGLDAGQINACITSPATDVVVKKQLAEIDKTGYYGTPTVFINENVSVGPKPYRVYAILLKGLFYWMPNLVPAK